MRRALFAAPLLVLLFGGPRQVSVRFMFTGPSDSARTVITSAVTRGMFADSLIVPSTARFQIDSTTVFDPNRPWIVLVKAAVVSQGDSVDVSIRLLNILGKSLVTDSVHIARGSLDSVATHWGRRYAE